MVCGYRCRTVGRDGGLPSPKIWSNRGSLKESGPVSPRSTYTLLASEWSYPWVTPDRLAWPMQIASAHTSCKYSYLCCRCLLRAWWGGFVMRRRWPLQIPHVDRRSGQERRTRVKIDLWRKRDYYTWGRWQRLTSTPRHLLPDRHLMI